MRKKINVKVGVYNELTKEEAELYFQYDADSLEEIQNGNIAILFVNDEKLGVQYAIIPEGFNPANIDEFVWDEWENVKDIIEIL